MNWRPISTAPRDGTFVMLARDSGYHSVPLRVDVGCWSHSKQSWCDFTYTRLEEFAAPIFWLPIPGLPSEPTEEEYSVIHKLESELRDARAVIASLSDQLESQSEC